MREWALGSDKWRLQKCVAQNICSSRKGGGKDLLLTSFFPSSRGWIEGDEWEMNG
jgi:hypothetical protein